MDTLTAIFTRRSTRHFEDRPIEDDKLRTILEAAMSGPSCVNSKDWAFIVVTERETLDKMAEANGRPAQPLKEAVAGILVCGDMERAFERAKDYRRGHSGGEHKHMRAGAWYRRGVAWNMATDGPR